MANIGPNNTISLPKSVVIVLLAFLFLLGYIITPYWKATTTMSAQILLLIFTIAGGVAWVYCSARSFDFRSRILDWIVFFLILCGVTALNVGPLTSTIGWKGDEDFHIRNTLELVKQMTGRSMLTLCVIMILLVYLAWRRPIWAILPSLLLTIGGILYLYFHNPLKDMNPNLLLRYPFINYFLFAIPPKLATFISNPYSEFLYRIIPLLSMSAVVYFSIKKLASTEMIPLLVWGLAIATTPIVLYYSSILYLEPLSIVLMIIATFRIKTLVESELEHLVREPSWYALICIGFIKETTLIFLGCYIFLRMAWQLTKSLEDGIRGAQNTLANSDDARHSCWNRIVDELGVAFSVLFPALYYLSLRNTLIETRFFIPHPVNLTDTSLYTVVIRSYMEQFGILLFLFAGGMIIILRKMEYTTACFLIMIVVAYPIVHILDHKEYTGYSRFNLFALPSLLAGSMTMVSEVLKKSRTVGTLIAVAIIVFNLQISPIQKDGTKKSGWGTYLLDVSEHYYPYNEAFLWISETYRREPMLIAGFNYPYFFDFYFQKLDWHPNYRKMISNEAPNEADTLSRAIIRAEQTGCTVILFHVLGQSPPRLEDMHGFRQIRVFENMSHMLVVYHLKP